MRETSISVGAYTLPVVTLNTVVVGTGAAGYNAADRLHGYGQRDIAIVTDHVRAGTSRNTGSDKQTYYKLTLSGGEPDSVREMAETLFAGQCVDGDLALCEASPFRAVLFKTGGIGRAHFRRTGMESTSAIRRTTIRAGGRRASAPYTSKKDDGMSGSVRAGERDTDF